MDGVFHAKPLLKLMIWGVKSPIFGSTPMYVDGIICFFWQGIRLRLGFSELNIHFPIGILMGTYQFLLLIHVRTGTKQQTTVAQKRKESMNMDLGEKMVVDCGGLFSWSFSS